MLKKITISLVICLGLATTVVPVYAAENQALNSSISSAVIQRNDVFVYKYATINGIRFRRLWNATQGCWAEDTWTPCP